MEGEIEVFKEGINPNDIIQGDLEDQWFLAAVQALSENPSLIERLFITKDYNPFGFYKIRLCIQGEW